MGVLENRVKEYRTQLHMSQREFADAVGISRETLSRIERSNYKNPSYLLVYAIALYLKKPVEKVFFFCEEETNVI